MAQILTEHDPFDGREWNVVLGPWTSEVEAQMLKTGRDSLYLNHTRGWTGNEIDFLARLIQLRRLEIISWDIRDPSVIGTLPRLEYLSLQVSSKSSVGFESLRHLETCVFQWIEGNADLFRCRSLKRLSLIEYPYGDLAPLSQLTELSSLGLADNRRAKDVDFLKALGGLKFLSLAYYRALTSVQGLENLQELQDT